MNTGFKAHYFKELAELEAGNFWFLARNKLILWALHKYCPEMKSFHEIGCGTGFVISAIAEQFWEIRLIGSEYLDGGLVYAKQRLPGAEFMQMDARKIPYESEFDAIGIFDVLEHIEDDETVLQQVFKSLKPEGWVFITVPQHGWLWSVVDEYACHVRRYEAKELHQKVSEAGFKLIRSTSFVTTLLPAMYASRLLKVHKNEAKMDEMAELRIHPFLNAIFKAFLAVDRVLIRMGVSLPVGGSRLVIAQKPFDTQ